MECWRMRGGYNIRCFHGRQLGGSGAVRPFDSAFGIFPGCCRCVGQRRQARDGLRTGHGPKRGELEGYMRPPARRQMCFRCSDCVRIGYRLINGLSGCDCHAGEGMNFKHRARASTAVPYTTNQVAQQVASEVELLSRLQIQLAVQLGLWCNLRLWRMQACIRSSTRRTALA